MLGSQLASKDNAVAEAPAQPGVFPIARLLERPIARGRVERLNFTHRYRWRSAPELCQFFATRRDPTAP